MRGWEVSGRKNVMTREIWGGKNVICGRLSKTRFTLLWRLSRTLSRFLRAEADQSKRTACWLHWLSTLLRIQHCLCQSRQKLKFLSLPYITLFLSMDLPSPQLWARHIFRLFQIDKNVMFANQAKQTITHANYVFKCNPNHLHSIHTVIQLVTGAEASSEYGS